MSNTIDEKATTRVEIELEVEEIEEVIARPNSRPITTRLASAIELSRHSGARAGAVRRRCIASLPARRAKLRVAMPALSA
jgi:hypothetical protein